MDQRFVVSASFVVLARIVSACGSFKESPTPTVTPADSPRPGEIFESWFDDIEIR